MGSKRKQLKSRRSHGNTRKVSAVRRGYHNNTNPDLLPESVKQVLKVMHPSLFKEK